MGVMSWGFPILYVSVIVGSILLAFSLLMRLVKAHERIALAVEKIANRN
jgi:hypothetical protein